MSDDGSERTVSEYDSEEDLNEYESGDEGLDEFQDDYDDEFPEDEDDEERRKKKPHRHVKTKDDTRTAILEGRSKRIGVLQQGPEAGVTISGSTYRPRAVVSDEVFGPPLNFTGEVTLGSFSKLLEKFYNFRGCYREVVGVEVK